MSYLKCDGDLVFVDANTATCTAAFSSHTFDYDLLLNELAAINNFDPAVTSMIVVGSLVLFVIGYYSAMVLKRLRQA